MIDFHEIYRSLSDQMIGNQKKIPVDSCIEVFFGFSFDGNLRLSFLSKNPPPIIESTTILHVVQGRENKNTYWTSFDLLNSELKEEVNASVREICKHYGVKLVELHDIDKKGGHPSIAGMKAIADQLK